MKVGIIANITKENIFPALEHLIKLLEKNGFEYFLSDLLYASRENFGASIPETSFIPNSSFGMCDIVISFGGDGTMLNTAYDLRMTNTPVAGINFGKLGFLAEYEINGIEEFIKDLKEKNYITEERMALQAKCGKESGQELYAINDLVLDKGRWPKMIELTIQVNGEYVTTFSADGLIVSTPTGTTGYSLSTGGPIVVPNADVITICPIAPHTLTMRPLVVSADKVITVTMKSQHTSVQVNCDGQRVNYYEPPVTIEIMKSNNPFQLIHTNKTNYFEILRNKLFWGIDLRKNS